MILVCFILLCLICLVKIVNNNDIIKEKQKSTEDKANIKNARKVYSNSKTAQILLILVGVTILIIILCQFTKIDTIIINYFSSDFYEEDFFKMNYYYLPAFLLVIRQIIIEVKVSEFLYKYFNVTEEEINTKDLIKGILYKKKPANNKEQAKEEIETQVSDTSTLPEEQRDEEAKN